MTAAPAASASRPRAQPAEVHVVLPAGVDDPSRPSGGNRYDRRVLTELRAHGWTVREHAVPGAWPAPAAADPLAHAALGRVVRGLPDGAVVLLDGLVACAAPAALLPHAARLRLLALVHMPLGHRPAAAEATPVRERERAVLRAAAAVVATSDWTRRRLTELYGLGPALVALPGVDPAPLAPGSATGGGRLLCVAAVTPEKGHDVLLDALAALPERPWLCACAGSLERDPAFVAGLRRRMDGLRGRVRLDGPLAGADLERAYAAADLLVLPSRAETYGMVVTEALARGVPVLASDVGGVREALGRGTDGALPGLLVPAGDADALADALRAWLADAGLRERLRAAALERRASLPSWRGTADVVAEALAG